MENKTKASQIKASVEYDKKKVLSLLLARLRKTKKK